MEARQRQRPSPLPTAIAGFLPQKPVAAAISRTGPESSELWMLRQGNKPNGTEVSPYFGRQGMLNKSTPDGLVTYKGCKPDVHLSLGT